MPRILRRFVTVGLATALLSMSLGVAPAFAGAESTLVSKVNSARASNGKAALEVHGDLRSAARSHSKKMADQQKLFHNPNLGSVTTGWKALGENVGVGPNVDALFDAFMGSSSHRANILGSYNYIGVGVEEDDNGIIWVTMVFMLKPDGSTSTTTTTTEPPSTTTTQPPSTTTTQPPSSTTTTQPPSTTTTQPPSTTTTTRPPSTTTTTQPPSTTSTTEPPAPDVPVQAYEVSLEELEVLTSDWVPPTLFRLIGSLGH